jgi:hypothetical protein
MFCAHPARAGARAQLCAHRASEAPDSPARQAGGRRHSSHMQYAGNCAALRTLAPVISAAAAEEAAERQAQGGRWFQQDEADLADMLAGSPEALAALQLPSHVAAALERCVQADAGALRCGEAARSRAPAAAHPAGCGRLRWRGWRCC